MTNKLVLSHNVNNNGEKPFMGKILDHRSKKSGALQGYMKLELEKMERNGSKRDEK
jgi:hypothetical protein